MKKAILFLVAILSISYSNAQEQKKNYHFNGILESSGQIDENNFPIGEWKYYSKEGDLNYELNHTTNYSKEYYTTGKLKAEGTFNPLTGVHIKKWITYYKNGQIKTKGVFDENGEKNGKFKTYFKNGTLDNIAIYKEGVKQE
ncbi:MAG: hypothetical protein QM486_07250 [Flavobacteriaceae bacterium]